MDRVPATRRRHSAELKARVLGACDRPGASVARIAMEHGLNANVVHKWRRRATGSRVVRSVVASPEFVPVSVLPPVATKPIGDSRIAIRRGGTTLDIQWPMSGAESCARRLHRGGFVRTSAREGAAVELTTEQVRALVLGLPWQRLKDAAAIRLY